MNYKTIQLKADEGGKISGFFSTYEKTPDSYGDIIEPGAFTGTIERRKATGHPFPLCFNHDFSAVIGAVDTIEEREVGPYIEGEFLETQLAQDVRKMCLSGAIWQFSFAYEVLKRRDPDEEEQKAGVTNVLQELEVFEISVVTVPANQNAVATGVKGADPDTKAGKRNSKADEEVLKDTIASMEDSIKALKSLIDTGADDKPEEDEEPTEETEPEVNEASEEQTDNGNSKRTSDLLEKINFYKEATL